VISSATGRLFFDCRSSFSSRSPGYPGLGCSFDSNVTIEAVLGRSLLAVDGLLSRRTARPVL
jgi:hypothetical protein